VKRVVEKNEGITQARPDWKNKRCGGLFPFSLVTADERDETKREPTLLSGRPIPFADRLTCPFSMP